ncbi:abortive infection system antitoxin AbiGi family protein [Actinomadura opuntiae]|uniref:abortive infection system antitoxin AbiGi family protein n=1 Tax=Actinomadura sp. OS1-43 TaxID=604315 RepID=UPI00255AE64A|nr:abortive infection system antitoxin AbiGi family protein [Actinomadura sp. OS1-43]MDL4815982.1 abortive infection system antitoxin AbiGi family protein [Actinomadura sp. OS1-43]
MLGYRGNENWRDMSEYLVHLTDVDAWGTILRDHVIKAERPLGTATNLAEKGELDRTQHALCLSEIPLDQLDRLVEQHGRLGIGFRRSFVRERGGAPVWYVHRDTTDLAEAIQKVVGQAMVGGINPADPIWKLTPFIDKPGSGSWGRYEFEWEREWRVLGDLEFRVGNIEFLIIPEEDQPWLRERWAANFWESMPPVIDITWEMGRLQAALIDYKLSEDEAA